MWQELRRFDPAKLKPGESESERQTRIVDETLGSTPAEVARSPYAVSERTLRKWRRGLGRNPETGHHVAPERLPAVERRLEVHRLVADDMPVAQVARVLGEHPMTVWRDLKTSVERQAA